LPAGEYRAALQHRADHDDRRGGAGIPRAAKILSPKDEFPHVSEISSFVAAVPEQSQQSVRR
jgi:hypothetical protein